MRPVRAQCSGSATASCLPQSTALAAGTVEPMRKHDKGDKQLQTGQLQFSTRLDKGVGGAGVLGVGYCEAAEAFAY